MNQLNQEKNKKQTLIASGVVGTSVVATSSPVLAQTANNGVTAVNALVTDLGTITAGVTTVIIAAMGVRMAIKFVNRMMVKG